jgi:hypothetical protein
LRRTRRLSTTCNLSVCSPLLRVFCSTLMGRSDTQWARLRTTCFAQLREELEQVVHPSLWWACPRTHGRGRFHSSNLFGGWNVYSTSPSSTRLSSSTNPPPGASRRPRNAVQNSASER